MLTHNHLLQGFSRIRHVFLGTTIFVGWSTWRHLDSPELVAPSAHTWPDRGTGDGTGSAGEVQPCVSHFWQFWTCWWYYIILYYSISFKSFQNAAVTWFANNRLVERWIPGWYRPTISYVVFSKHNHDQPSSFPEDGHEERSAWERAPGEAPAACHTGPGRRGRRRFFEGKRSSKHRNECLGIHHFWGLNIKSWRLTD